MALHRFSSDLNARQRRIVHEKAEQAGIYHVSQGPENARFITISTKPIEIDLEDKPTVTTATTTATILEEPNKLEEMSNQVVEPSLEKDSKPVDIKNNFEVLSVEPKPEAVKSSKYDIRTFVLIKGWLYL